MPGHGACAATIDGPEGAYPHHENDMGLVALIQAQNRTSRLLRAADPHPPAQNRTSRRNAADVMGSPSVSERPTPV